MTGVIFVNPSSGPDEDIAERLAEHFEGQELRSVEGADVEAAVRDAVAAGADFVGMAGGDGSIRTAAAALAGGTVPLLPVPGGTKNHFAKAMGLPTFEAAGRAAEAGRVVQVDLGSVNGECFVNNASIGVYPLIVRARRPMERHLPKQLATVVASWHQIRDLTRIPIGVDGGATTPAWMVFVGNGCYGTNVFQAAERETLDQAVLDLRICHADARMSRLRAAGALLAGRIDTSTMVTRRTAPAFELETTKAVDVALDGEVLRMESPLRFETRPSALYVLRGDDT